MTKNDELHLTCGCHGHEIHFERDEWDEKSPMWYVSMWLRGYRGKPTWSYRWKQIKQILDKGVPYGDEVILERKDLLELQEYINTQLNKTEKKD